MHLFTKLEIDFFQSKIKILGFYKHTDAIPNPYLFPCPLQQESFCNKYFSIFRTAIRLWDENQVAMVCVKETLPRQKMLEQKNKLNSTYLCLTEYAHFNSRYQYTKFNSLNLYYIYIFLILT